MIYTLIISLVIEKPFYLLRPQSFSFQIVSEFLDIFVKFSDIFPERRVFVHNDCPREGGFLLSSSRVPGGMILDEIDTWIRLSNSGFKRE